MNEQKSSQHRLSSTQVEIPQDITEDILKFTLSIPDEKIFINPDPDDHASGRELEPHITIKYGLETISAADVEGIIDDSNIKTLSVTLQSMSLFEPKDKQYDVLKVGVSSSNLVALNKVISELPNQDVHPVYTPHLTIAYVKKVREMNTSVMRVSRALLLK